MCVYAFFLFGLACDTISSTSDRNQFKPVKKRDLLAQETGTSEVESGDSKMSNDIVRAALLPPLSPQLCASLYIGLFVV